MPLDPSISLGIKPVEFPNPLEMALKGQALRNSTLQGNQLQQTMDSNSAMSQAMNNHLRPDGTVDIAAANADFSKDPRAAFNAQQTYGTALNQQQNQTALDSSKLDLAKNQLGVLTQQVSSLVNKPDLTHDDVLDAVMSTAKNLKLPPSSVTQMMQGIPDDPTQLKPALTRILIGIQDKATQLQAQTSQVGLVSNGQQITPTNMNPNAGPIAPIGAPIQQQLPPTTPIVNGTTPGYLGPQPSTGQPPQSGNWMGQEPIGKFQGDPAQIQSEIANIKNPQDRIAAQRAFQNQVNGNPEAQAQKPAGFVASGLPMGAHESIGGTVDVVNKDWDATNASAKTASQDIGVLQNIKKLAPGAITGVTGDRRAFIAGLAGLIGMSSEEMAKTDTDLLAKNSNMLALAGGNTDAARALAEAANPNTHMTPAAIQHAADQVIAQRKLALAKQQYLQPFKALADTGHPEAYNQASAQFNQASDPRILQLPDMSPQEKAQMKASMSAKEAKEFGDKIRMMQTLGIVK